MCILYVVVSCMIQAYIINFTCRFRSKLTDTYGEAQKPIVYCGRGRPPKRALLNAASGGMVCLYRLIFILSYMYMYMYHVL